MKKLLHYLKINKSISLFVSGCFLTAVISVYFINTIPFYRSMKIVFAANMFESAKITIKTRNHIIQSSVDIKELQDGEIFIPGSALLSFQGLLKKEYISTKEVVFYYQKIQGKENEKNNFLAKVLKNDSRIISYSGNEISINADRFTNYVHGLTCILSSLIIVCFFYFIGYFLSLRPSPYKGLITFGLVSSWMLYHLLANWPGLISFDAVLNYYDAQDLIFSVFVQPLTTMLNAAFLNIYPHYVWNTLLTIFVMATVMGLIAHYFSKQKIALIIFLSLILFFLYNPLNTFTNLFINRDSLFSWVFFGATICPIFSKVVEKKKVIFWHLVFLILLVLSIEIRKEVLILLPFSFIWSYLNLELESKKKIYIYTFFSGIVYFSMFGTNFLKEKYTSPIYQSTVLINPIADILHQKGLGILTDQEQSNLKKFIDLDSFSKNFNIQDITPFPFMAIDKFMTKEDLVVLTNLYIRLVKDYPFLWIKNRTNVLIGSLGLNKLSPSYAYNLIEEHSPKEYYSNLHSLPFSGKKIEYPKVLSLWKKLHWDGKGSIDYNRYVFNSFTIPLLFLFLSLPFLLKAPATAFAVMLNIGRIVSIFPFIPATYFKYMYAHYLMFLFLPLFIYVETYYRKKVK